MVFFYFFIFAVKAELEMMPLKGVDMLLMKDMLSRQKASKMPQQALCNTDLC